MVTVLAESVTHARPMSGGRRSAHTAAPVETSGEGLIIARESVAHLYANW